MTATAALESLLATWNQTPARAVAEAVLVADAALGLPAFTGTTDEWLAAAAKAKLAARGPLLAALTGKTLAETRDRLAAIVGWAGDPRTIHAIEMLISAPPWSSDSSKPTWNAVFALIAASNSARFVEIGDQLAASWNVRASFQQWLHNALKRALKGLPAASPVLAPDVVALVAAVPRPAKPAAKAKARDEAELLADIYAEPHDDGPRLVYADLLQERGDPRGELIALQLSGGDPKRQKALLKEHGKAWLGAIAPVLGADYEFRRGFLARAMVKLRHKADADKFADRPEWATVEDLTWSHPNPIPAGQAPFCRKVGAAMRGLTRAFGAWAPDLLAARTPWAIEELEVGIAQPSDVQAIIESPLLPKLKRLIIDDHGELAWFANVASLRAIETLEFYPDDLSAMLRLLSRYDLETYRARRWLTATRGSDGQLSRIVIHLDAWTANTGGNMIGWLADGLAESIELDVAKGITIDPRLPARAEAKLRGDRPSFFTAAPVAASTAVPALEGRIEIGFRPDGALVVLDESRLLVIDATGTQVRKQHAISKCYAARVIRGGTQVVAIGYKRVHLFDVETGADLLKATPKVEDTSELFVTLTDDGRFVTIANDQVFDLEAKVEVKPPRGSGRARVIRPDLAYWVQWKATGAPHDLMRAGSTQRLPLEASADIKRWRFLGGGLVGQSERAVRRWDLATGKLVAELATGDSRGMRIADGERLLAVLERAHVLVVDAETLAVRNKVAHAGWRLALDARGERIASVDGDGALTIIAV